MRTIKFVAGFSACGFILSFVFGIFSHTSFLSVLLKAFIFAIIFGILGVVIFFLANKFLLEETESDFGGEAVAHSGSKDNSSKGHVVDITIKDEELPQSVSENHFVVGNNHQMLNDTDYNSHNYNQTTVAESEIQPDENEGFKPIRNLETVTNLSSKEAIQPNTVVQNTIVNEDGFSEDGDKGIDVLPDMQDFTANNRNDEEIDEDENSDDDDDSSYVSAVSKSSRSSSEMPEIKDASLYAKAISSVLSGEEN